MNRWLHYSRTLGVAASLMLVAAAANAQGINLSWNDCGATGSASKTFSCTTNTLAGAIMVASAQAGGAGLAQLNGQESVITLQTNQPTLSSWWQLASGGCRGTTAISSSFDFTGGPFTCVDAWAGGASGGMNSQPQFDGPNRERFRTVCAVPAPIAITGTDEYYFFKLTILGAKSTGTGACAGCDDGACIVFTSLLLTEPAGVGDLLINTPLVRQYVTWQAGGTSVSGGCPAATPTNNRTWGSVKSLYR